ncbi:glucuronate isomerase [Puniceicoccus vermicola]|uniref:Uronate isomerase n=1 Tax=Puniceicoccus vermicola TaxID=388746 RepID=A0A7X1E511_9BACT|nr:glucuronate isomerase [Puniceicoccus vermicola]MBC2602568.1 glucuronate isomerase [Puniceicoccus vermicola]
MNLQIDDRFLLKTEASRSLYIEHAANAPLIDFHTHLSPKTFVENQPFSDISELWVASDPYKWRAMRIHGVPERFITGDASAKEKFAAWASTLPHLIGNPLYDWARMELAKYFQVDEPLSPENASEIREVCNQRLQEADFRPQALLQQSGVETFVTSDSWLDSISPHLRARQEGLQPQMFPSLRADAAFAFGSTEYPQWLQSLREVNGHPLQSLADFLEILSKRLDDFNKAGCRLADHGMDTVVYAPCSDGEAEAIFAKILTDHIPSEDEVAKISTFLILWLSGEYTKREWTLQLHMGARRETSSRLAGLSGKAGGFAVMRNRVDDKALVSLLDQMEHRASLPRIILYSLHAADYDWMSCLSGSFVEEGLSGKVQLGPAWWFNDHHDGIERQLRSVAAYGVLAHSVGMNTDSRSFLSSVRHRYFRRILCNLVGEWVEAGRLDPENPSTALLLENICFRNARNLVQPKDSNPLPTL